MLPASQYDKVARAVAQKDMKDETILKDLGYMINYHRYHTMYPMLPDLPMSLAILGQFGAGKSSTIITLVSILQHFNLFNEMFYFSDSGLLDGKMSTFLRFNNKDYTYATPNLMELLGKAYKERGETPPWEKPKTKPLPLAPGRNPKTGTIRPIQKPKPAVPLTKPQMEAMAAVYKVRRPEEPPESRYSPNDKPEERLDKMRAEITPWKLYIFDDATEMPFIKLHSPFTPFWTSLRHIRAASIMAYHSWKQPSPQLRLILTGAVLHNAGHQEELDKITKEMNVKPDVFDGLMHQVAEVPHSTLLINKKRSKDDKFTVNMANRLTWKEAEAIASGAEPLPGNRTIHPEPDPLDDPAWRPPNLTYREEVMWDTAVAKIRAVEALARAVEKTPMQISREIGTYYRREKAKDERDPRHYSVPPPAGPIPAPFVGDRGAPTSVENSVDPMRNKNRNVATLNPTVRSVAVFHAAQRRVNNGAAGVVGKALSSALGNAQARGDSNAALSLIKSMKLVRSHPTLATYARVAGDLGVGSVLQGIVSAPAPPARFLRARRFTRSSGRLIGGAQYATVGPDIRALVGQLQAQRAIAAQVPAQQGESVQIQLLKLRQEHDLQTKKFEHTMRLELEESKARQKRQNLQFEYELSQLKQRDQDQRKANQERRAGYNDLAERLAEAGDVNPDDDMVSTTASAGRQSNADMVEAASRATSARSGYLNALQGDSMAPDGVVAYNNGGQVSYVGGGLEGQAAGDPVSASSTMDVDREGGFIPEQAVVPYKPFRPVRPRSESGSYAEEDPRHRRQRTVQTYTSLVGETHSFMTPPMDTSRQIEQ